jgi:hypothetical protein
VTTPPAACTSACTSEAENANAGNAETDADQGSVSEGTAGKPADPLAALAAAIANLTPADRARLVAMLAGYPGRGRG